MKRNFIDSILKRKGKYTSDASPIKTGELNSSSAQNRPVQYVYGQLVKDFIFNYLNINTNLPKPIIRFYCENENISPILQLESVNIDQNRKYIKIKGDNIKGIHVGIGLHEQVFPLAITYVSITQNEQDNAYLVWLAKGKSRFYEKLNILLKHDPSIAPNAFVLEKEDPFTFTFRGEKLKGNTELNEAKTLYTKIIISCNFENTTIDQLVSWVNSSSDLEDYFSIIKKSKQTFSWDILLKDIFIRKDKIIKEYLVTFLKNSERIDFGTNLTDLFENNLENQRYLLEYNTATKTFLHTGVYGFIAGKNKYNENNELLEEKFDQSFSCISIGPTQQLIYIPDDLKDFSNITNNVPNHNIIHYTAQYLDLLQFTPGSCIDLDENFFPLFYIDSKSISFINGTTILLEDVLSTPSGFFSININNLSGSPEFASKEIFDLQNYADLDYPNPQIMASDLLAFKQYWGRTLNTLYSNFPECTPDNLPKVSVLFLMTKFFTHLNDFGIGYRDGYYYIVNPGYNENFSIPQGIYKTNFFNRYKELEDVLKEIKNNTNYISKKIYISPVNHFSLTKKVYSIELPEHPTSNYVLSNISFEAISKEQSEDLEIIFKIPSSFDKKIILNDCEFINYGGTVKIYFQKKNPSSNEVEIRFINCNCISSQGLYILDKIYDYSNYGNIGWGNYKVIIDNTKNIKSIDFKAGHLTLKNIDGSISYVNSLFTVFDNTINLDIQSLISQYTTFSNSLNYQSGNIKIKLHQITDSGLFQLSKNISASYITQDATKAFYIFSNSGSGNGNIKVEKLRFDYDKKFFNKNRKLYSIILGIDTKSLSDTSLYINDIAVTGNWNQAIDDEIIPTSNFLFLKTQNKIENFNLFIGDGIEQFIIDPIFSNTSFIFDFDYRSYDLPYYINLDQSYYETHTPKSITKWSNFNSNILDPLSKNCKIEIQTKNQISYTMDFSSYDLTIPIPYKSWYKGDLTITFSKYSGLINGLKDSKINISNIYCILRKAVNSAVPQNEIISISFPFGIISNCHSCEININNLSLTSDLYTSQSPSNYKEFIISKLLIASPALFVTNSSINIKKYYYENVDFSPTWLINSKLKLHEITNNSSQILPIRTFSPINCANSVFEGDYKSIEEDRDAFLFFIRSYSDYASITNANYFNSFENNIIKGFQFHDIITNGISLDKQYSDAFYNNNQTVPRPFKDVVLLYILKKIGILSNTEIVKQDINDYQNYINELRNNIFNTKISFILFRGNKEKYKFSVTKVCDDNVINSINYINCEIEDFYIYCVRNKFVENVIKSCQGFSRFFEGILKNVIKEVRNDKNYYYNVQDVDVYRFSETVETLRYQNDIIRKWVVTKNPIWLGRYFMLSILNSFPKNSNTFTINHTVDKWLIEYGQSPITSPEFSAFGSVIPELLVKIGLNYYNPFSELKLAFDEENYMQYCSFSMLKNQ